MSAARLTEIEALLERWKTEPEEPCSCSAHCHTIPASPDDVEWLLALVGDLERELALVKDGRAEAWQSFGESEDALDEMQHRAEAAERELAAAQAALEDVNLAWANLKLAVDVGEPWQVQSCQSALNEALDRTALSAVPASPEGGQT